MSRATSRTTRLRRHARVRKSVTGTPSRPRLAVFRSNRFLTVQLVDDTAGKTLAAASTTQATLKGSSNANMDAAKKVGSAIAQKAKSLGIENVVFDRGGYRYHGRVAAIADAAREAGLKF